MGSSSSKPALSENQLAVAREEKVNKLMLLWYETALQMPPPSLSDPNLVYNTKKTDYYLTNAISSIGDWISNRPRIYDPDWIENQPTISVDWTAVNSTISQVLADTTGKDTSQGYSTCVIKSFDGKFNDIKCLYKLIIVAVSFNFSNWEYLTIENVTAFGYWVYLFHTDPPFRYAEEVLGPTHVEPQPLAYKVPNDMSIVGKKFMTVEELDRYNP
ncbi:hypothetical protein Clacol_000937 [Clathrus columnatus]|uniref:Uncharacterized protein n=1 Tax=Clathrus columnatus TaxID=1419009 RepID=A0AAV5A2F6_9AGAM|nr:hypothetical protein Clacol_000937 [Clathrus columnatus]